MVRPDSSHYYPGTLGNKPIAVQFHAGSHYVALRLLEGYLRRRRSSWSITGLRGTALKQ